MAKLTETEKNALIAKAEADAAATEKDLDEIDSNAQPTGKNAPVFKIKSSGVSITAFKFENVNERTRQKYSSYSLGIQRSYKKSAESDWINTPYLRPADLLIAAELLREAYKKLQITAE